MATYYKKIKGKKYDGKLLRIADSSVRGKGDGRISLKDAKKILGTVKDSNDYSVVEKGTIRYIRDSYSFTPEADRWFRSEIRKWAATKGAAKPSTKKSKKSVKKAVKKAAKKTTKKAAKKAAKKGAKKAARKIAKKAVKKAARKPVKKSAAKKVKKSAPKTKAVKKTPRAVTGPSISRQPSAPRQRDEYEYEERMEPMKYSSGPASKKRKSSYGYWLLGLLIAALVIGLYVSPQCGKRIKEAITPGDTKKTTAEEKIEPPVTTPVTPEKEVVPDEEKSPEPEKATREIEGAYYHTVEPKEDLISISRKLLNDWTKWRDIYEANRDIITTPYVIHPGQRLRIPGLESEK